MEYTPSWLMDTSAQFPWQPCESGLSLAFSEMLIENNKAQKAPRAPQFSEMPASSLVHNLGIFQLDLIQVFTRSNSACSFEIRQGWLNAAIVAP